MSAYVISEATVIDEQGVAEYRALAESSIAHYGGRYRVMGATPEAAAGSWTDSGVLTIIEFDSMEQLREWYDSPEYRKAIPIRDRTFDLRLLFTDGLPRT